MMLAFEAVAAAKTQGLLAAENLDRALRRAFWAESRPIHLHHEIIDIAHTVVALDPDALDAALRAGAHRAEVFADLETASTDTVSMSPHLFLPDGTDTTNPGLTINWHGDWASGFPIVEHDDPTVYDTLLHAAAPG